MQLLKNIFSSFIIIQVPPSLVSTISILVGIICRLQNSSWYVVIAGVSSAWLFSLILHRRISVSLCINLLGCIIGYGLTHRQLTRTPLLSINTPTTIELTATVYGITSLPDSYYSYQLLLKVHTIKSVDDVTWSKKNQYLLLYTHTNPALTVADTIHIHHLHYKDTAKPTTYRQYLMKEGIATTLFCHTLNFTLIQRPTWSFERWIHTLKTTLFVAIQQKMSSPTFAFFSGIFLGNRTQIKATLDTYKDAFQLWGISHYLARSGLHLVIINMMLLFLLRLVPVHIRIKWFFLLVASIIYHFLTWPSISFIRALYTTWLYCLCGILGLSMYTLNIFCLVCGIVLLFNPLHCLFLDFQLSFGLTFALAWLGQLIQQRPNQQANY